MTTQISKKIVGWGVVKQGIVPESPAEVVEEQPVSVKFPRPEYLCGATYRIDPTTMDAAMYVTINDFIDENGRKRPYEVFVNTKSIKDSAWIMALMLVVSAVLRRPGNFEVVLDELENVCDPRGGYWLPNGEGMCPSVVAHVGRTIKKHYMRGLGSMK